MDEELESLRQAQAREAKSDELARIKKRRKKVESEIAKKLKDAVTNGVGEGAIKPKKISPSKLRDMAVIRGLSEHSIQTFDELEVYYKMFGEQAQSVLSKTQAANFLMHTGLDGRVFAEALAAKMRDHENLTVSEIVAISKHVAEVSAPLVRELLKDDRVSLKAKVIEETPKQIAPQPVSEDDFLNTKFDKR